MKLNKKIAFLAIFSSIGFLRAMEKKAASFDERLTVLEEQVKILQSDFKVLKLTQNLRELSSSLDDQINSTKENNPEVTMLMKLYNEFERYKHEMEASLKELSENQQKILASTQILYNFFSEQEKVKSAYTNNSTSQLRAAYDNTKEESEENI